MAIPARNTSLDIRYRYHNRRFWYGWEDSNLQIFDSKSNAYANSATPTYDGSPNSDFHREPLPDIEFLNKTPFLNYNLKDCFKNYLL